MVTSIQLGNFFNANGRTVLGGVGGSGLDTESLIKALTDARALPATRLQDQITRNGKVASALSDFKTLLSRFKSATDALRNPPGVNNAADNAFRFTTASVISVPSSTANYMTISAAPGASLQNYTINEITSLAAAKIQTTGNITLTDTNGDNVINGEDAVVSNTPGANHFKAGTFTLKGRDITLSAGDSLNAVAAKINAVSTGTNGTGISANVIKVSEGVYKLSFVATKTGTASDFDMEDVYDEDTNPDGILIDEDDVFGMITLDPLQEQEASNAVFKLNNIEITRSTNSITDAVSGITFNLLQVTPEDTELSISINPDTTTAQNSIINFISVYNEIRTFFAQQTRLNADGTTNEESVLANSQSFRSVVNNITSQVSSIVSGLASGNPNRLADVGISFYTQPATTDAPQVSNLLTVDDGKLAAALASNINAVANLFGFDFQSSNPDLKIFSRTNALNTHAFTLTVNPLATQTTSIINIATSDLQIVFDEPAAGQLKSGTITVNGQSIVLEDGDTLDDVVQKFNDVSDDSGMEAALQQVEPGKFRIIFTSTPSGSNNNFDLNSTTLDPSGVFDLILFTSQGSYKATYNPGGGPVTVDVDGVAIGDTGGYTIKGRAGTPLEGLVMVYANNLAASVSVDLTQGLADKLYNLANEATLRTTGPIDVELTSLKTSDSRLQSQIDKINEQVETYRNQLLDKFGALEAALSRVNTLLQSLDAQATARKNA